MRKTTILLRTYLSIRAQLKFGFGSYREFLLEEHKRNQNVLTPLGSLEPALSRSQRRTQRALQRDCSQ